MKRRLLILVMGLLAAFYLLGCILSPSPTATVAPSPTAAPPTFTPTTIPTMTTLAASTATPTAITKETATSVPSLPDLSPYLDWQNLAPYKQAMLPAFAADVDRFVNATRYVIGLNVDLDQSLLNGKEIVRYTNQEQEPLAEIVFRLLPNTPGFGARMTVESVQVNGQAAAFDLAFEGSAVYVPLPVPLAPGQAVELELLFQSTLPGDASAGYAQYGYFDEVLALPNFYPLIPVYDDEGWNVELAPTYGDATFSDTALFRVLVTLPQDMIVATSGVIVEKQPAGPEHVTYTCVSGPMRDFNIVASAKYHVVSSTVENIRINSYYLSGNDSGGKLVLDYANQAMHDYQRMIGPYPFTELDVMATPTEAGGIEYPGLIVIATRLYTQSGGFFEMVVVHEAAHQWWYSMVGNDQLDEPWLDEALAQYTSLLYFEDRYGKDTAERILADSFKGWYADLNEQDRKTPIGLPVSSYPEQLYGPIVYGKGPVFFDEMRKKMGDTAFFKLLHTYFQNYRYAVAYPQNLMDIANEISQRNLDNLYQEWVTGQ